MYGGEPPTVLRVASGVARPLHAAVRADDALHEASTRNEHPVDAADDAMIHDQQPRRLGKRQPKQRQLQESLRNVGEPSASSNHPKVGPPPHHAVNHTRRTAVARAILAPFLPNAPCTAGGVMPQADDGGD